jgi:tRNA pseudouridine38-40 synthase
MQCIKLVVEYDGTDFVGWQTQLNGTSVQGELEKALALIVRQPMSTVAAGRTDAGVHACAQVVSFLSEKPVDSQSLMKNLNGILPPSIAVLSAEEVSESFHARYSARRRVYRYYLSLQPTALRRAFTWYVGGFRLSESLLRECAETIVGEHDFSSFCKGDSGVDNFVCMVFRAAWTTQEREWVFEIEANRFLYGMVRALVGTMVEVARGHRTLDEFRRILDAKDRAKAGMSAPARGLVLERVIY